MRFKATLPLPELRRKLQDRVNEIRGDRLDGGVEFDGHRYETDDRSLRELAFILAAIGAGIPLPAEFVWRTAKNENVPHTDKSLKSLAEALLGFRQQCRKKSWELKDLIESSPNPASIDTEASWPESKKASVENPSRRA
jgi:hypothetical protein